MKMKNNKLALSSTKIVITRSKDKISEVKSLFQNEGATVFEFPALIIGYPNNLKPLDKALSRIHQFDWIIFSSSNGIKFVNERLIEEGLSLKQCAKRIKIAVVGEKTSDYLNKLGIEADYIPTNFISESLIDNFPSLEHGSKILLPRVETGGRSILADHFRKFGSYVLEVPAYESSCPTNIPTKTLDAFQQKIINAMIFSSGKTVKNSAFLLEKHLGDNWLSMLDDVYLFTIGPQTSLACKSIFGRVDKQADQYTFDGLLAAVIETFN